MAFPGKKLSCVSFLLDVTCAVCDSLAKKINIEDFLKQENNFYKKIESDKVVTMTF